MCVYVRALPLRPRGAAEAPNVGPSTLCSYRQRVTGRRAHLPFLGCQSRFRISTNIQWRYGPKGQAGSKALDNHCLALFPHLARRGQRLQVRPSEAASRLCITTAKLTEGAAATGSKALDTPPSPPSTHREAGSKALDNHCQAPTCAAGTGSRLWIPPPSPRQDPGSG